MILEVCDGIPIRAKTAPPVKVGDVVSVDGGRTAWEVKRFGWGGVDVQCLRGERMGSFETWSRMSPFQVLPGGWVAEQKARDVEARARAEDETRCPNCWGGEAEVDGVDRGRDYHCLDHQLSARSLELARTSTDAKQRARRRRGPAESLEDVARVLELRAQGLTYKAIEAAMGWPEKRGSRPYDIVKAAGGAEVERPRGSASRAARARRPNAGGRRRRPS